MIVTYPGMHRVQVFILTQEEGPWVGGRAAGQGTWKPCVPMWSAKRAGTVRADKRRKAGGAKLAGLAKWLL